MVILTDYNLVENQGPNSKKSELKVREHQEGVGE